MAQNPSDGVDYYLRIDVRYRSDLSALRQWSNLKVAFEDYDIWVTNFDFVQIESVEVKSIPVKSVFYGKNGKLFPLNSLLPTQNEPNLLWTPIQRAFSVKMEKLNHNYFGIEEKLDIDIVPNEVERTAEVMLVSISKLEEYIQTAPEVRLKNIQWIRVDQDVLLMGMPLLPLDGKVFWRNNQSIFPVGYNFDLSILNDEIGGKIDPQKGNFIMWNEDACYFLIEKDLMMPLSLGSFRKTMKDA